MSGEAEFERFYADSGPHLQRQLITLTRDFAEAQDCVQEAYARAWQRWPAVREHPDPEAWVRTVAYRCAISRFRRMRSQLGALLATHRPEHTPGMTPDHAALVGALRQLPVAQRQVVALHYLADLPVEEVAPVLKCPVGTVKSGLSAARAGLNRLLDDSETTSGDQP